ncbi:MAG: glycoside hydrolase family 1 protein, partial [Spirochaetota bacterium]
MDRKEIKFPDSFLWGAASSSHQVEGNNEYNQWWEFEQRPHAIKNGDASGIACDHYNRYEEDFQLLKELNHTAHRISFEWSRFYPESPEELNQEAVTHYHKVLDKLHELEIEPFVTTFHFTLPIWFAKKGGFEEYENIKYYEKFVEFIAKEYKDKIKYWNTINEPAVYAYMSYQEGEFPPAKKNIMEAFTVLRNIIKAHGKAYHIIKEINPESKVGIVKSFPYFVAREINNPLDRMASSMADWLINGAIIKALKTGELSIPMGFFEQHDYIKNSNDFIGLNYYVRKYSTLTNPGGTYTKSDNTRTTKMGWEVFPEGIYLTIMRLHRELNIPVYITENGIATDDDSWRIEFIKSHLKETHRAIKEGADVRGYFYWSNIDNFEWAEGFSVRMGLVYV